MDLRSLSNEAERLRATYELHNAARHRRRWEVGDYAAGFAGDVGQLVRLAMAYDGRRDAPLDLRDQLVHEVNDCLWSVLVLADQLGIDLGCTFPAHVDGVIEGLTEDASETTAGPGAASTGRHASAGDRGSEDSEQRRRAVA